MRAEAKEKDRLLALYAAKAIEWEKQLQAVTAENKRVRDEQL
jgi:hypothetical protein